MVDKPEIIETQRFEDFRGWLSVPVDKSIDFHVVQINQGFSNVVASTGKMTDTDVINADVHKFDNFVWYDASSDFKRVNDTTFTINTKASGILGIDYNFESGDNKADIYVDGELFKSPTVEFSYDFSQRHILIVGDDCTVKNEIKVVFNTKEQADGFKGMCFSWE